MAKKPTPASPAAKATEDAISSSATPGSFPVVGIGASAGGLSAFTKLFKALPTDTGMAFVLIQHLDPKHTSLLPELIARSTAMPVAEVSDGMRVEPNHIYAMPPNHSLALLHGVLHLMPRPDEQGRHLPVDDFLQSLAQDQESNAIGIILSGTASDGSLGIQAIKAAGGITFAQSEDSTEYSGMPHSAIATGHVDFVLTPEEIANELMRIAQHPYLRRRLPEVPQETLVADDGSLSKIFVMLRARTGIDFTYYKQNTIQRRIKRRMVLYQLIRMKDYLKFLQTHPKELEVLFQDMLINVTSFFRDPETFAALKNSVFPHFLEKRTVEQAIRIWIPACSTGEEAYSVAIALFEFLGERNGAFHIQIFASDIDKQAIDKARKGVYPQSIDAAVEPERLRRFFTKTATGYQICQPIRDVCVFAVQNVAKDPPFSRLDLICCRNLMIYLGSMLQKKVLHTFHYALRPSGYLMLGTSESIGSEAELFSLLDKKNKIYTRKSLMIRPDSHFNDRSDTMSSFVAIQPMKKLPIATTKAQQDAVNLILEKYGPPGVIINQDMQILNFHGQTGPYIEPSAGSANLNLLKMVRQDMVLELHTAVQQAIREHGEVRKEGVRIRKNGGYRRVNLLVLPLPVVDDCKPDYLVLFESGDETAVVEQAVLPLATDSMDARDLRIRELETELNTEREYMQSIIEQQEEVNEELQSANEEIQSANEELQSTNEELETAKEELQSTNEELATIIQEHAERNLELSMIGADLANLLASIDLAIVIVSEQLLIRRFTAAAKPLLNLIDSDIARPISNIRPNIDIPDLERRVQQVIETIEPQSFELRDHDGHWYMLRLRPYRTLDNHIEGVVMTFVNIDSLKEAERLRQAIQHEQCLAAVVRNSSDAVILQDFAGRILAWNRRAEEMYGYSEEEALRLNATELIPDEARAPMHVLWEKLRRAEQASSCESWRRAKSGRVFKVWLTTSTLLDGAGKPNVIVITEREQA